MYSKLKEILSLKNTETIVLFMSSIIAISATLLLVFIASFNIPVADQLFFINSTEEKGVIGDALFLYSTIGGRLLQFLTIGLSYKLFNPTNAQILVPILLIITLILAYTWLLKLLFNAKKPLWQYLLMGSLLACTTVYTTYCLFDSFLWLDAALVYLLGSIMILLDIAIFIWLSRQPTPLYKNWKIYPLLLLVIIGQTAGETSTFVILFWTIVAFLLTCLVKQWRKYRKASFIILSAIIVGTILLMAAPGLWSRADTISITRSSIFNSNTLIHYPLEAFLNLINSIQPWQIGLSLITIITIGSLTTKNIRFNTHLLSKMILLGILIPSSFSYITFVIYCHINQTNSIAARVMTVPGLGLFLGSILIGLALYYYLSIKTKRIRLFQTSSILIIIVSIIFSKGFVSFNRDYYSIVSARRDAYISRNSLVNEQLKSGVDTIIVPDIPVMVNRSNATDFTTNNWAATEWYYDTFKKFYNITNQKLLVTGIKLELEDEVGQPDWYINIPTPSICVSSNKVALEKYWCENQVSKNKTPNTTAKLKKQTQ